MITNAEATETQRGATAAGPQGPRGLRIKRVLVPRPDPRDFQARRAARILARYVDPQAREVVFVVGLWN